MKALMFSNYGSWETTTIGLSQIVNVTGPEDQQAMFDFTKALFRLHVDYAADDIEQITDPTEIEQALDDFDCMSDQPIEQLTIVRHPEHDMFIVGWIFIS